MSSEGNRHLFGMSQAEPDIWGAYLTSCSIIVQDADQVKPPNLVRDRRFTSKFIWCILALTLE